MYRILVVGGDKRNIYLANILDRDIFEVSVCGFKNYDELEDDAAIFCDVKKAARNADVIVLGLPVSKDGKNAACPYGEDIPLCDIIEGAKSDCIIVGAKAETVADCRLRAKITDIAKREDFAHLNSVPTAEGAIQSAMSKSKKTIHGSLCMVTGFGKCAETLALALKALGARVDVFARSARDLAKAKSLGFGAYHLETLAENAPRYDMIFNSVPFGIFDGKCTASLKRGCIFTDIASAPGGIADDADKTNIDYSFLPGLPGIYSPLSAAEIIQNVILQVMRESRKDFANGF